MLKRSGKSISRTLIALGIIIVLESAAFAYYYFQTSQTSPRSGLTTTTSIVTTGQTTTQTTTETTSSVSTAGKKASSLWQFGSTIQVGHNPIASAYDPVNNDTYVANYGSGYVSVLSPSGKVVQKISTGSSPSSIAYDSSRGVMFVSSYADSSLTMVGAANNSIISKTSSGGTGPTSVAFNPMDGRIYVINNESGTLAIFGPSLSLVGTANVGSDPQQVMFNPANGNMYITTTSPPTPGAPSQGEVLIAFESGNVSRPLVVGAEPRGLAYDTRSRSIYVADCGDNALSIIDSSGTVSPSPITVGQCPTGMIYDSATNRVVVSSANGTVYVINGTSNRLLSRIRAPGHLDGYGALVSHANAVALPVFNTGALFVVQLTSLTPLEDIGVSSDGSMAYNPQNKEMYLTDPGGSGHGDYIWVWSAATYKMVTKLSFDMNTLPHGIAYSSSDHNMYVAVSTIGGHDTGYVYVIDSNNNVANMITIGDALAPYQVTYDSNDGNIYVTAQVVTGRQAGFVFGIDTSGNIIAQIPVGGLPHGLAYNAQSGNLLVADNSHGMVEVVSDGCECNFFNITVGGHPDQVAFDAKSNLVFSSDYYGNSVSAIFGPSVVGTFSNNYLIGVLGIASDAGDGYLWSFAGTSIVLINGQTLQIQATLYNYDPLYNPQQQSCEATAGAFDPVDGTMWVVNSPQSSPNCASTIWSS